MAIVPLLVRNFIVNIYMGTNCVLLLTVQCNFVQNGLFIKYSEKNRLAIVADFGKNFMMSTFFVLCDSFLCLKRSLMRLNLLI